MCFNQDKLKFFAVGAALAAWTLVGTSRVAGGLGPQGQTVNCVVAVVNGQVITLTDVKIVEAFGMVEARPGEAVAERRRFVLERLIDQKAVIDLVREKTPVDPDKLAQEFGRFLARLGRDAAQKQFEEFGIGPDDLKPYLEEKIIRETIIANRFGRGAGVSLREIEAYYNEIYVPDQKKLGKTPPPMIEVLGPLEEEVKKNKVESQVALWIRNLRQQAEIEIREDCLKK